MLPEGSRLAAVLALLLLGSGLLVTFILSLEGVDLEAQPLKLGDSVERKLPGGGRHLYRVSIESGNAVRVVLDPKRDDLVLGVLDPFHSNRLQVDSRNGFHGPEILYVVGDVPGKHIVEVRSYAAPGTVGSYELIVGEPHRASQEDRLRASATFAFSQGERLFGADDEESAVWFRRALEKWEEAGDLERATATRYRLGRALQRGRHWEEARGVYRAALQDALSRGDVLAEACLRDRIGRTYFDQNRLDDAGPYFEQSRDLFKRAGYQPGEADTLGGLMLIDKRSGDFHESLKLAFQALDLYTKLKRQEDEALLLQNIGELYFSLGEPSRALDAYERAEEIGRDLNNPNLLASALGGQGNAYAELGQLELATPLLQHSVELWHQVGNPQWEIVSQIRLGDVYTRAQRLEEARNEYGRALALARTGHYRREEAMALGNLGHLFDLMDMERQALSCFDAAQSIFRDLDDPDAEAKVLKGRAEVELELGEIELALSSVEQAAEIVETLRSPLPSAFSDRRELYNLYVDILMRLHEKTPEKQLDRVAFDVAERSRSRSFLDEMKEKRTGSPAGDPRVFKLEWQLRALENKRSSLPDGSSADAVRAEIDEQQRGLEARLKLIRADSKRNGPVKPLTLAEVQASLEEDTVLLFYFLGGSQNLLWEVTRTQFITHRLSLPRDFEKTAEQVWMLLAQSRPPNPRAWASQVEKLSDSLLRPVAGRLKERILVSPDGVLHRLPFATLLDPDTLGREGRPGEGPDSPQFLILKRRVLMIPSISMVAASRAAQVGRPPAPQIVAVLTDPVFDGRDERAPAHVDSETEFSRLRFTEEEGKAILRVAPPGRSFLATGFRANRETAISPELGLYRYLHFATHAKLRESPDLSGIVLSHLDEQGRLQDGFLRAFEIYDLNLSSELVVLSACETALGSEKGGLVRAFLHAGSKRVLATLWKVPDRSTAVIMESFYEELLRQGLAPDAALQRAQISMLESERWKAPHYWAGFVLQGEWQ